MSYIPPSLSGGSPLEKVMGHAPHILLPWLQLESAFFSQSLLSQDLLEQVRRTLARQHGCLYCQAKGGPPDISHEDLKISLAVGLAELFAIDHKSIGERQLDELRRCFTNAELVELVAFMGFMWAGGAFGAIMGVKPSAEYTAEI